MVWVVNKGMYGIMFLHHIIMGVNNGIYGIMVLHPIG